MGPSYIIKSGEIQQRNFKFRLKGEEYSMIDGGISNDLALLKVLNLSKVKIGGSYQWGKTYLTNIKSIK